MTTLASIVGSSIAGILNIYLIILLARIVLDWVLVLARDWRPTGILLVLVEVVYTLTDPPIKALSKVIPSIRVGMFDFQLTVVFLILFIGIQILSGLALRFL